MCGAACTTRAPAWPPARCPWPPPGACPPPCAALSPRRPTRPPPPPAPTLREDEHTTHRGAQGNKHGDAVTISGWCSRAAGEEGVKVRGKGSSPSGGCVQGVKVTARAPRTRGGGVGGEQQLQRRVRVAHHRLDGGQRLLPLTRKVLRTRHVMSDTFLRRKQSRPPAPGQHRMDASAPARASRPTRLPGNALFPRATPLRR